MIEYPLFLMWKEGDFYIVNSFKDLTGEVEENDVYGEEFLLWDREGRVIEYGEHPTDMIWLKHSDRAAPNLLEKINEQLASRKLDVRVNDSTEFAEAIKLLIEHQQKEDRGLIAIGRRLIQSLWPTKAGEKEKGSVNKS